MCTAALPTLLSIALATTPVGGAPTSAQLPEPPAATPVQSLDDLPDGDMDYDEGSPAPGDEALPDGPDEETAPAGGDEAGDTRRPIGDDAADPGPEGSSADEELTPPPEERGTDDPDASTADPPAPASEPEIEMGEAWVDDEVAGEGGRAPVQEDFDAIEAEERARGRLVEDEEETPLIESPWFWGGVAGGALLLAGAAAGGGYLLYTLLFADSGTVAIVLE